MPARAPIEICVFASSPFGDVLDRTLFSETVGERSLSAREVSSAPESAGCHLLFIPAGAETRARGLLESGPHTVTVGESRFEQMGGVVTFVLEDAACRQPRRSR